MNSDRLLGGLARRCALLALVFASCVDGATGGDDATDSPAAGPPLAAAAITVRVLGTLDNPTPVAGAQISVNASDGSMITSGASDASGLFTVANPPAGASITVQAQDARSSSLGGLLQTYYDVAPGGTYTFRFAQPVAATQIATIHATISNAPAGTSLTVSAGPGCQASAGSTADVRIFASCVQSDGKVTLYATATRSDRSLAAVALLRDVTFTTGGTTNVALNTWAAPPSGQQLSFGSAPGPILDPNIAFGSTLVSYSFYRRGVFYTPEVSAAGKTSGNAFTTQSYLFPVELPLAEPGKGFQVGFSSGFATNAGSQYGGFLSRTNALPAFAQYDLHQALPVLDVTAFIDIRNFAQPIVTWTGSSGTFDGTFVFTGWQNLGDASLVLWLAKAPVGRGAMTLPILPVSMAAATPRPGARFFGVTLMMIDASWLTGYDAFTDQDSLNVLRFPPTLDVPPGSEGAVRYVLAVAATAPQFPAVSTPSGTGGLAELTTLLRGR